MLTWKLPGRTSTGVAVIPEATPRKGCPGRRGHHGPGQDEAEVGKMLGKRLGTGVVLVGAACGVPEVCLSCELQRCTGVSGRP
jgi:hypothetical protein